MEWEDKEQIHVTGLWFSFTFNITPVTLDYLGGASGCSLRCCINGAVGLHWKSTTSINDLLCLKEEDIPKDKMLSFLLANLCM